MLVVPYDHVEVNRPPEELAHGGDRRRPGNAHESFSGNSMSAYRVLGPGVLNVGVRMRSGRDPCGFANNANVGSSPQGGKRGREMLTKSIPEINECVPDPRTGGA